MEDYIPTPEELQNRELAYNITDDTLSLKVDSGLVQRILSFVGLREEIASNKIETGTTPPNGEWTKFPDGTLICKKGVNIPNTSKASGALFTTEDADIPTWTYPMPFVGAPPTVYGSTYASSYTWITCAPDLTYTTVRGWRAVTSSTKMWFTLVAIGRWK